MTQIKTKIVRFWPIMLAVVLFAGLFPTRQNPLGLMTLLLSAGLIVSMKCLAPRIERLTRKQLIYGISVVLLIMLGAQLLTLVTMPVTVYHDPYRVLAQAEQMAAGSNEWEITYFWRYPNNVPIAFLMSLWIRLTNLFSLGTNASIHLLSLICLDGFIVLALKTIGELSQRKTLVLGTLGLFVLSPFAYTYYLQVFYTDLPLLLVLLLLLRQFARWSNLSRRGRVFSGLIIVVASLIGMIMKPNIIVLVPALAIVALVLGRRHLLKRLQLLVPMGLVILGLGLSVPVGKGIQAVTDYTPHAEDAFPVTHWMMMGMNVDSLGEYSEADKEKELTLPDSSARMTYNIEEIQRRVQKMGPSGLLVHWFHKLKSLMNVGTIQRWYNGGYREAPSWYLDNVGLIGFAISVSYLTVWSVLLLWALIRLVFWRPDLENPVEVTGLLAVITALGFIAFQVFLWETGERYGQVLIPLLLVFLASTKPLTLPVWSVNIRRLGTLSGLLVASGALAYGFVRLADTPSSTVAAAQRSQLSKQYHAEPLTMKPGMVLTQKFTVRTSANYFSLQGWKDFPVDALLVNEATKEQYELKQKGDDYVFNGFLPEGSYEIQVRNDSDSDQRMDVVKTRRYLLSDAPLVIDGASQPYASFIYSVRKSNR